MPQVLNLVTFCMQPPVQGILANRQCYAWKGGARNDGGLTARSKCGMIMVLVVAQVSWPQQRLHTVGLRQSCVRRSIGASSAVCLVAQRLYAVTGLLDRHTHRAHAISFASSPQAASVTIFG